MSFDRVFVIGAGLMGHGIAQVSAAAGKTVTLSDRTAELAEKGKSRIAANLARQVEKGKLDQSTADEILGRIGSSEGTDGAAGHEIVIEAVFEDESVKRDDVAGTHERCRCRRDLRVEHQQHQHHEPRDGDRPPAEVHRPPLLLSRPGHGADRDHPWPRDR